MKKTILIFYFAINSLIGFSQIKETITDSRDGQNYQAVKIGKYTWMSENLRYKSDSSYYWQGDSLNIKYGKLYLVSKMLNVCPLGWHVPTSVEFINLIDNIGPINRDNTINVDYSGKIFDKNGFNAVVKLPKKNGKFPLFYGPVNFLGASEDWMLLQNASRIWLFLASKPYIKFDSKYDSGFIRCVKD